MILGRRARVAGEIVFAAGLTGVAAYYVLNNLYPSAFTSSRQHRACIEQTAAKLTGQTADPTSATHIAWLSYAPGFPILSMACRLKVHTGKPQPPQ
ncbi:MAG: hypothetical protein SFW65_10515 [Alphaproteobacteria bacterium]|nr:hypothetical protein [Alphaproteobacteria bacterium]